MQRFDDPIKVQAAALSNGLANYPQSQPIHLPILSDVSRNPMSSACHAAWDDSRSSSISIDLSARKPEAFVPFGAQNHESFPAAASGSMNSMNWGEFHMSYMKLKRSLFNHDLT